MVLKKTKDGGIYRFEDGRYFDLKTNKEVYNITPDEILETVKISLTLWQVIKQFIAVISRLFKKS